MIEVEVKRTEPVSEAAAATIAKAFVHWLEARGFVINHESDVRSYDELAEAFLQDWG